MASVFDDPPHGLRPRDLARADLPADYLCRLYGKKKLERVGRGLYMLPGADLTEHHTLAEAALRVLHGVVCLLSALRFHDLTTQAPYEVWMAIDVKARRPKEEIIPLRVVRFSGEALTAGVEEHEIEGVCIKVYSPAKTVADCFKYRNKIGLDVALEALRDYWKRERARRRSLEIREGLPYGQRDAALHGGARMSPGGVVAAALI